MIILSVIIVILLVVILAMGIYLNGMKRRVVDTDALKLQLRELQQKNTELKTANQLAEDERRGAKAADEAKGKFLAHMSHEIRTPINAVLGMNTMILRETSDMHIKEYALDIHNAGQNLLALVNDILDFSKIESGKLEIIRVEYDMSSMIHDISNMIHAKAKDKNLKFEIYIDEELPSKLYGDDVRIRQILVNLLNNAVKYTHEGTVSLSISGKKADGKAVLDFAVEDTGIGIKKEDIAKLFKEFERIEEKRNRNIEGTGLGMNITVQLLSLMNSTLNVESEYGKGSKFSFTIEQQIIDSTPVGNLEKRIREQSTDYSYMEVFTAPDAQILVVDDNATNLKVFVNLLKTTKVNVDVADGGYACLDMICKKRYDLIFLDHMMPDLDGIETLHRMKELKESMCTHTPVVALTANAITGAKEMYLAEGFDAFLSKPINPEKLEQMILLLLPRELLVFEVEEDDGNVATVDGAASVDAAGNAGTVDNMDEKQHLSRKKEKNRKNALELNTEMFPEVEGIDWNVGLMHLRDNDLLLDTVIDFYRTLDSEADYLQKCYDELGEKERALELYRVKVHAMKSSAALIGAMQISGVAKLLEFAARDGQTDIIQSVTPVFLTDWRTYKSKLEVCIPKQEKQEIADMSVVVELLENLRYAMEEMDIDALDAAMDALRQYEFGEDVQAMVDKLGTAVTNLDNDEVTELVEQIIKEI